MRHKIIYKDYHRALVCFILTAVVILLFLPREGRFKYEFQKGKPWKHDNLVAPFDFPIYKSATDLLDERNEVINQYTPYYIFDTLVERVQINSLKNAASEENQDVVNRLTTLLTKVYERGILNDNAKINPKNKVLSIIKGNVYQNFPLSDIFTVTSAYEYITGTLNNGKQQVNIEFKQYIQPNLLYDDKLTQQVKENSLDAILPTQGMVLKGDKIIDKGEVISASTYQTLSSFKREYEENRGFSGNWYILLAGQFLYICVCLAAMFTLLLLFRREILSNPKYLSFLLILVNLITIAALLVLRRNELLIYLVPFTIVPIYIATFIYSRPALFVHWISILLIANFVPNSFEFIFLNTIAGVAAIWGFKHLYKRGQLFLAVFLIFASYSLSYMALKMIQEGSFDSIHWAFLMAFAGNSLLIIILYQFTFVFERMFGFLSDSRLIELSDTNQKLLRQLSEEAPGTFQHALQVANIAEAVIREIGGNALLVRTGALYHDIGKIGNPVYFIENQSAGYNPHDALEPEKSAQIIIDHVRNGIEIARKNKLPEAIIGFIRSHHATSKTMYFYVQYKEQHPELIDNEYSEKFTYQGILPYSKETAVVMMVDSCEAASRSLKEYSIESISNLVDKLIGTMLNEGLFNAADITVAELSVTKDIIKNKLQNIHHNRIEYPDR